MRDKLAAFLFTALSLATALLPAQAEAKKTAFIVVNWGAPAFGSEAKAVMTQLQKLGWEVHLFSTADNTDGLVITQVVDGKTINYACVKGQMCAWQKIITAFLPANSVHAGDQVLLDIQGDGTTNIPNGLKLADGKSTNLAGLSLDMDSLLAYEEFATTFNYKGNSADMWASHSVEAFFSNMTKTTTGSDYLNNTYGTYFLNMISAGDAYDLSKLYSSKGAKVTVIDHSCQAGSTTKLLETLKDPNVCAISTTGIDSPGIQGTPPLSSFLSSTSASKRASMNGFTRYVSNYFYNTPGLHNVGARIHQIGYEATCTSTMAVRETADNATGAYSTWWDWSRLRASHVLRAPTRYTVVGSASNEQPWMASDLDSSFTDDCKLAGKNCNLTANPRLRVAAGWVRWFEDSLKQFEANHKPSAELTRLMNDGNALVNAINAYKEAIDELDKTIEFPENGVTVSGSPAMPIDRYFRTLFVQQCLCGNPAEVKRLNLKCGQPKDYLPRPGNWTASQICSQPQALIDQVVRVIPGREIETQPVQHYKAGLQALTDVQVFEAPVGSSGFANSLAGKLVTFSRDLEPFETSCNAASCTEQEF